MMNDLSPSPTVRTLPANRSLVVADSVYRDVLVPGQSPYNFDCKLNAAMNGKEVIYTKLYWSQPLFSHNNSNNELRFQINGDDTTTYVVYATPFLCFNQFDGNPEGSSFQTPQPYSYADNMEKGFNGDVRNLSNNLVLINGNTGILQDADGFNMTVLFRYSPSKGFVITFEPSTNPNIPVYTFKLLPCSYIANAHFVHGFGITTPESDGGIVPRDQWCVSYFSDDTPSLLPLRFITIASPELTKDRRMISFQNSGKFSRSLNELAIFSLNKDYTCAYHTELVGEDATIVSKRDDYNPQSFTIIICDEKGNPLQCSDPIARLLQDPLVPEKYKQEFLFGPNVINRGGPNFTNLLLFGTNSSQNLNGPGAFNFDISKLNFPDGLTGFWRNNCKASLDESVFVILNQGNTSASYGFPIYTPNTSFTGITPFYANYLWPGFGTDITQVAAGDWPYNPSVTPGAPSITPQPMKQSRFLYYPSRNPNPVVSFTLTLTINNMQNPGVDNYNWWLTSSINFIVGLYSYTTNNWVAATIMDKVIAPPLTIGKNIFFTFVEQHKMQLNPLYNGVSTPQSCQLFVVPFTYPNPVNGVNLIDKINLIASFIAPSPAGSIGNEGNVAFLLNNYFPPNINVGGPPYSYGNPLANGLCEEVIHELITVLKDN